MLPPFGRPLSARIGLASILLTAASWAAAAPSGGGSASDVESARELIAEARRLQAAGRAAQALEKLEAAYALVRSPVTGMELAKAHLALGHLVEARALAVSVATMPVAQAETDYSKKARVEAVELANALEPRIPSLRIILEGVPADRVATVTVDGETIPPAALGEPRKVNPGVHEVVARVDDGPPASASVTVAEKERRDVTLVPTVPPKRERPAPPSPPGQAPPSRGVPTPAVAGMIVGGAGLLAGTIAGATAAGMTASLECSITKECGPSEWGKLDAAKAVATTSTIAFVVGGVAAAFGLSYWLFSSAAQPARAGWIAPTISPTFAGVHGAF
jgi:hypothetical protein